MDLDLLLNNVGLIYNGKDKDGIWHSCGTTDKPRSSNGRYYIDGEVVFWYNWRTGCSGGINIKCPVVKVKRRMPMVETKVQTPLQLTFDKCNYHEYVERKKCIYKSDLMQFNGNLIIPMQNYKHEIMSYQMITSNGKYFAKDRSSKNLFYRFTTEHTRNTIILAEGWATANAIHQCTPYDVIACLSAGNIRNVYNTLKSQWGNIVIIVIADNDEAGIRACQGLNYITLGNDGEDFNDIFIRLGLWDTMDLLLDNIKDMA